MKVKQQTLKGFECEIDDVESFKAYYTKNEPLMRGHLLILSGLVDDDLKMFLDEKEAAYIDSNKYSLSTRKKRSTAVLEEPEPCAITSNEKIPKSKSVSMVFHRTIRSGEALHMDDDLVFFGRINSGALIESSRSIQIFGIIDGIIRCEGEYILLKEIGQGSVFFHGEELDKSQFNGQLKVVEYKNGITIKEI